MAADRNTASVRLTVRSTGRSEAFYETCSVPPSWELITARFTSHTLGLRHSYTRLSHLHRQHVCIITSAARCCCHGIQTQKRGHVGRGLLRRSEVAERHRGSDRRRRSSLWAGGDKWKEEVHLRQKKTSQTFTERPLTSTSTSDDFCVVISCSQIQWFFPGIIVTKLTADWTQNTECVTHFCVAAVHQKVCVCLTADSPHPRSDSNEHRTASSRPSASCFNQKCELLK